MVIVTVNAERLVRLQDLFKQARVSYTTRVSLLNDAIEEIDSIIVEGQDVVTTVKK